MQSLTLVTSHTPRILSHICSSFAMQCKITMKRLETRDRARHGSQYSSHIHTKTTPFSFLGLPPSSSSSFSLPCSSTFPTFSCASSHPIPPFFSFWSIFFPAFPRSTPGAQARQSSLPIRSSQSLSPLTQLNSYIHLVLFCSPFLFHSEDSLFIFFLVFVDFFSFLFFQFPSGHKKKNEAHKDLPHNPQQTNSISPFLSPSAGEPTPTLTNTYKI
ncbi:MAG: hypothetical protein JOS17DRAFT_751907, partial [Linnemannia elongata]